MVFSNVVTKLSHKIKSPNDDCLHDCKILCVTIPLLFIRRVSRVMEIKTVSMMELFTVQKNASRVLGRISVGRVFLQVDRVERLQQFHSEDSLD